jgi:hypothetical protein
MTAHLRAWRGKMSSHPTWGNNTDMALKMRPTGLGSGLDKDRPDFSIELWRVNSPFSLLAGRTRVRK